MVQHSRNPNKKRQTVSFSGEEPDQRIDTRSLEESPSGSSFVLEDSQYTSIMFSYFNQKKKKNHLYLFRLLTFLKPHIKLSILTLHSFKYFFPILSLYFFLLFLYKYLMHLPILLPQPASRTRTAGTTKINNSRYNQNQEQPKSTQEQPKIVKNTKKHKPIPNPAGREKERCVEGMGDGDCARKRWTREEKEGEEGGCTARSGSGSWSGDNLLAGPDGLARRDRPPQPNLDAIGLPVMIMGAFIPGLRRKYPLLPWLVK
jgi:hypothetical protein